jgi:hypothetical protein
VKIDRRPSIRLGAAALLFACVGQGKHDAGAINGPFTVSGARVDPDSLNAYLAAHHGFTSRGGEMLCAYRPLGQSGTRVFVWAVCTELLSIDNHLVNGSGMSLPAAFQIEVNGGRPRVVTAEIPEDGSGYGPSIRRIFPPDTWPAISANGTRESPAIGLQDRLRLEAAARFGLPPTAAAAERRFAPEPGYTQDSGVFARVVRGDTTTVDEFVRTTDLLHGVVRTRYKGAKFGWARYRVEFSPSGEAARAELSIGRVGTSLDSPAASNQTIIFGPDSIVEQWPNRSPTHVAYVRGTVPIFAPSIAMLQEVVRRASRMSPPLRELGVPVYHPLANAGIDRVRVRWITRDTVAVFSADGDGARYVVRGWKILSGRDREFITVRVDMPPTASVQR